MISGRYGPRSLCSKAGQIMFGRFGQTASTHIVHSYVIYTLEESVAEVSAISRITKEKHGAGSLLSKIGASTLVEDVDGEHVLFILMMYILAYAAHVYIIGIMCRGAHHP